MKRTPIAGAASALFLAAALVLGGCGGDPASISSPSSPSSSSQPSSDSSVSSTAAPSSATTSADPTSRPDVEPFVIPDPVTGTYNGKTITMQYAAVTYYIWPMDNLRPYAFINGYAPFYVYEWKDGEERLIGGTYMDKTGRILCDPVYKDVYPFNEQGIGLAQKEDGGWVYIDTNGTATDTDDYPVDGVGAPGWFDPKIDGENAEINLDGCINATIYEKKVIVADFMENAHSARPYGDYSQLFDSKDVLLNETKFERIGNFYNGLAPVILNNKLGIVDSEGNIVIEPSYPSGINPISDMFYLSEDLILMNTQGHIGIIEIIRT